MNNENDEEEGAPAAASEHRPPRIKVNTASSPHRGRGRIKAKTVQGGRGGREDGAAPAAPSVGVPTRARAGRPAERPSKVLARTYSNTLVQAKVTKGSTLVIGRQGARGGRRTAEGEGEIGRRGATVVKQQKPGNVESVTRAAAKEGRKTPKDPTSLLQGFALRSSTSSPAWRGPLARAPSPKCAESRRRSRNHHGRPRSVRGARSSVHGAEVPLAPPQRPENPSPQPTLRRPKRPHHEEERQSHPAHCKGLARR